MRSVRLATTMLHSLRPVGTAAERDHGLLAEALRQEFGPEGAELLAEPVAAQDGSKVDWYVSTAERPLPLADLPEDEREALLAKLDRRKAEIALLADRLERGSRADQDAARALRHATVIPGTDAIYRVGTEPVLVAWGYTEAGRPNYESGLRAASGSKPSPTTHAASAAAMALPLTGDGQSLRTSPQWRWPSVTAFLWALLALLIAIFLWLLLTAFPAWRLPFVPAFPGLGSISIGGSAISIDTARLDALRLDVAGLERQAADARVVCLTGADAPGGAVSSQTVAQRIDRSGAQGGALQISLTWDGTADLDLSASCPNGARIDFGHASACGGRLDIDANAGTPASAPVENIFWNDAGSVPAQVPLGVTYYGDHGDPRPEIPFRIRIRRSVADLATGDVTVSDEFVDGVARRAEMGRAQIVRTVETTPAAEAER